MSQKKIELKFQMNKINTKLENLFNDNHFLLIKLLLLLFKNNGHKFLFFISMMVIKKNHIDQHT